MTNAPSAREASGCLTVDRWSDHRRRALGLPRQVILVLLACFIATTAGGKTRKPGSMAELAREVAERLPHYSGVVVYVAMPAWEGHRRHYALCQTINQELVRSLSAAEPADKFYGPAQAAGILAKAGVDPLDVYFGFTGKQNASYAASMIGAEVAISAEIEGRGDGISLTVEAMQARREKRLAKLAIFLDSPHLRTLLSLPDVPIKDSAGVYEPGVGGVSMPRCTHCPNPHFRGNEFGNIARALILVGLTVNPNGRVSNVVLLSDSRARKMDRRALRAVRGWKFTPATGPSGKPVPVRILAEIQFRAIQ